MSPDDWSSLRRSDNTESLIPTTLRLSSAKPEGPFERVPRSMPFQRFPRNSNARARAPSHDLDDPSRAIEPVVDDLSRVTGIGEVLAPILRSVPGTLL